MKPDPAGSLPPTLPATVTADGSVLQAAGTRLAGRYRLLELVGAGGMGMVYRAHDEQLDLPVAVKVLRPGLVRDVQRLGRFKQELVLARQVSHPNVVRTHDIGSDGETVFLTMDFVPGRSLDDWLAEEGKLSPERAVAIGRQIASALAAAHEAGVVHRDLKPANVLVEESGRTAIADFGIARSLAATGSGPTLPGTVMGTPDYLSPEQARGEEVDGRADLFALGLILYEMLTGALPFAGGSHAEVMAQHATGTARDLSATGVAVPRLLAEIVRKLLQRDPARRYQSAREVLADLDRLEQWCRRRALPRPAMGRGLAFAELSRCSPWRGLFGVSAREEGHQGHQGRQGRQGRQRQQESRLRAIPSPCCLSPTRPAAATSPGSLRACRKCSPLLSPRAPDCGCWTARRCSGRWRV